jgi:hypothetical protein
MNITRAVLIGVAGGALAAWFAAASTSTTPPVSIQPTGPRAVDKSGAELAAEIGRLHEHLHPTVEPDQPARDLFAFRARTSRAISTSSATPPVIATSTDSTSRPMPFALIGVAEDSGVRTAIVSGSGELFLVKEGEHFAGDRYTVVRIDDAAIEVADAAGEPGAGAFRLALK